MAERRNEAHHKFARNDSLTNYDEMPRSPGVKATLRLKQQCRFRPKTSVFRGETAKNH
jgi:hypothetical protein